MRRHHRKGFFLISIICVLTYAFLFSATIVFADEPAPPVSTEEVTSIPPTDEVLNDSSQGVEDNSQFPAEDSADTSEPEEQAPATEESVESVDQVPAVGNETVDEPVSAPNVEAELLDQFPTDTQIVVLVDGQVEPLATQVAADALVYGDPIWCPAGVTPGNDLSGDCTDSFGSFNAVGGVKGLLVADATNKDLHDVTGNGTIYVQSGPVLDTDSIIINGNVFIGLQTYELTIQGGWDFVNDKIASTPSIFTSQIRVVNWQNNVTVNDISLSNTISNGLTVTTTGDINLNNVTSSNNSNGNGVVLNNSSGSSGNIKVSGDSNFSNNNGSGLVATSNGNITLQNVIASNNGNYGTYLNNRGGGGSITISGTNVFNHNYAAGLAAYSDGDITLNNVTAGVDAATGNGTFGALLNNSTGAGNVALSGINIFNNNTTDGLRIVSNGNITTNGNLTANNNGRYGTFVSNNPGSGYITLAGTVTLKGNAADGLRALSNADITIAANLTASNNSQYGAFLNNSSGTGNIFFTGTGIFNENAANGLRVLSAGNITSTTSLTANDNNSYGVNLDNTAGTGHVNLSGTNTFSGNSLSGLRVLSDGAVSLANVIANNNGKKGNPDFRYGVFVDNRTGIAGVTISGKNEFSENYSTGLVVLTNGVILVNDLAANDNGNTGNSNANYGLGALLDNSTGTAGVTLTGLNNFIGNYSTGLWINSKGDVALNNTIASNNGGYGASLDNSTGTGKVSLAGTNQFNSNTLDGLKIASAATTTNTGNLAGNENQGNGVNITAVGAVELQNVAASDNSGGHGLVVTSGSTANLTGANNMSGNLLSGVHVTASGNIDIYYTTASANGQDGFYLHTDSASFLRCGGSNNNGLYGINAVNNNRLYLYGMGFSGNALGDINVDGGKIYLDDCSSILSQGSYIGAQPGINNVYMTNARGWVVLDCQLNSGTKLILPNGDFVYLPCPIGETASLQALGEQKLPGALPSGSSLESGINFGLMENDQSIEQVDGLMTISFVIPESMSVDDLSILFWNGSEWVEVDGASPIGNHLEAQIDYTGIFILVSK